MLEDIWGVVGPILGIVLVVGLIWFGLNKLDNHITARRAEKQQAITTELTRMGYRDRDNIEVYLKSTDWHMKDFLKSKTVRQKYKEWTK